MCRSVISVLPGSHEPNTALVSTSRPTNLVFNQIDRAGGCFAGLQSSLSSLPPSINPQLNNYTASPPHILQTEYTDSLARSLAHSPNYACTLTAGGILPHPAAPYALTLVPPSASPSVVNERAHSTSRTILLGKGCDSAPFLSRSVAACQGSRKVAEQKLIYNLPKKT